MKHIYHPHRTTPRWVWTILVVVATLIAWPFGKIWDLFKSRQNIRGEYIDPQYAAIDGLNSFCVFAIYAGALCMSLAVIGIIYPILDKRFDVLAPFVIAIVAVLILVAILSRISYNLSGVTIGLVIAITGILGLTFLMALVSGGIAVCHEGWAQISLVVAFSLTAVWHLVWPRVKGFWSVLGALPGK